MRGEAKVEQNHPVQQGESQGNRYRMPRQQGSDTAQKETRHREEGVHDQVTYPQTRFKEVVVEDLKDRRHGGGEAFLLEHVPVNKGSHPQHHQKDHQKKQDAYQKTHVHFPPQIRRRTLGEDEVHKLPAEGSYPHHEHHHLEDEGEEKGSHKSSESCVRMTEQILPEARSLYSFLEGGLAPLALDDPSAEVCPHRKQADLPQDTEEEAHHREGGKQKKSEGVKQKENVKTRIRSNSPPREPEHAQNPVQTGHLRHS